MSTRTRLTDRDFRAQLAGYSLTTAEILYHLPDHPSLLQSFIWQEYDVHPLFPRLQEFLQSRGCELPRYEVVDIQGEPHCRTFFVECEIILLNEKSRGQGVSRRIAEQVAAAAALIALGVENGND